MKIIETCPKCGHDLINIMLTSNPPIPKKECWNCGWSWTGEIEEIVRVPFGGNATNVTEQPSLNNYINTPYTLNSEQSPCDKCSNNVKNGGSGICNCILGLPKVTC